MKALTMKIKVLTIALMAGFISLGANAGFEQFNGGTGIPSGEMNVFSITPFGSPDFWLFWSKWGVPDLQAIDLYGGGTANRNFELFPNVNAYAEAVASGDTNEIAYWTDSLDGGITPGFDGNAYMEATTLWRATGITNGWTNVTFSVDVGANNLDPRYSVLAFVRVREPIGDWVVMAEDSVTLPSTGSYSLSLAIDDTEYAGYVVDAGWTLSGLNANPAMYWGSMEVTATELYVDTGDTTAPTPDPMSFEIPPHAISDQAISMTASNATDISGVEYLFSNVVYNTSSGWQSSPTWIDSGLAPDTFYTYTVTARDLSIVQNSTDSSDPSSASTLSFDSEPPIPDPTIASTNTSPVSIKLTSTTVTDASEVEYYFTCTDGILNGGNDSGWQSSPTYVDIGLVPGSNYTYTVTARDLAALTNTTVISSGVIVTTADDPGSGNLTNSLQGFTGDTSQGTTVFDLNIDSLDFGSVWDATVSAIVFDSSGARFGEGVDYWGRNVLRTIGQDYDDSSFEAYATIVFDGTVDQAAFIGLGQGIIAPFAPGNWGVPELALYGVNGVVGEIKTDLSNGDPKGCNLMKIIDGQVITNTFSDPVDLVDTFRVELVYDADLDTATISIDTNYTGGAFVADRVLGTIDTTGSGSTNMWYGAPARVYVGGGEGTIVKDFEIVITQVYQPPFDIQLTEVVPGIGTIFFWNGVNGRTYDVQSTTNLVTGPWVIDPVLSDITTAGGMISVTSTVNGASVFFKVISE